MHNPYFWNFRTATKPAMWKSRQARSVFAEACHAEAEGLAASHALTGSVKVIQSPSNAHPELRPYGTPRAAVERSVRERIAALRSQADTLEAQLAAHGTDYFTAQPAPVPAPMHPFDAETVILGLLHTPRLQKLIVHGTVFSRDTSGAFRPERS